MNLKQFLSDDDAVSPVIGVILMVAITVILAAVIATFVLGLGEQVSQTSPQASFSFEYSNSSANAAGNVTVTHDGGDSIKTTELFLRGSEAEDAPDWDGTRVSSFSVQYGAMLTNDESPDLANNTVTASGDVDGQPSVVAGDSAEVGMFSDGELRIVYQAQAGDTSATLGTWEGPDN